jgi:hypothetical protein
MRSTAVIGAVVAVAVGALVAAGPAWATPTSVVVQGRFLRIVSVADWDAAGRMTPQSDVPWDLAISTRATDGGTVTLSVTATGDEPIRVTTRTCAVAWQGAQCPASERVLASNWMPTSTAADLALEQVPASATTYLRLDVQLAPGAADVGLGAATTLTVHARGGGDSLAVGTDGALAATGGDAPTSVLAIGVGLLAAGAMVLGARLVAKVRRGRSDGES